MIAQTGGGPDEIESSYAWLRLAVAVTISTVGGVGMWSFMVALPALQTDFGVSRAEASFPFTMVMFGFAAGGVLMGRLADRFGIAVPLGIGTLAVAAGYLATGWSPNLWLVSFAHGLIGLGCSASFGPLMADISHWFVQRRGIAVAIAASGNYVAGTIWPPVVQHFIATSGWRATHIGIGLFCLAAMLPLAFALRRRLNIHEDEADSATGRMAQVPFSPLTLQAVLCIAGVACCVAMSMPQVHIVAYCGDLGYGVARGAEMLSLMLGFGIVSRIGSGFIADRIGGVRTLLLGSLLQGVALFLYLWFDGLASLYVISAVRPFPGRNCAELRHHCARIFPAARSRHAAWRCTDGDAVGHGPRWLAVGPGLRPYRLLPRGLPERARLEPAECCDHGLAAAAHAASHGLCLNG